jgi:hypothetical protein
MGCRHQLHVKLIHNKAHNKLIVIIRSIVSLLDGYN